MSLAVDNKIETIQIPSSYKNIFLKIVDNFSAREVEEKFFVKEDIISQKIKEINEKEKNGEIEFVSFEEWQEKWKLFLNNLFSN